MSDLISRADAIEAMRLETAKCGLLGRGDILGILSALPSADTNMSEYSDRLWKIAYERGKAETEQHNKDAISREGLLKSWEELSPRGRTEFDQVIMTIPALPSAEAEPKRVLQGYCKGADCKWWNPQVEGCNRCVFVEDEYTHPSAEAVQGVGRYEKAMQKLREMPRYLNGVKAKQINKIPSEAVQGEWIDKGNWMGIECSRCKCHSRYVTPFCPQCGARMKGGEDE